MQLSVCRGSHSNDVVRYGMVRIGRYGIDRQCPTTKGNADDEGLVGIFVLLVRGHHVVVCLPFAAWTYHCLPGVRQHCCRAGACLNPNRAKRFGLGGRFVNATVL